VALPPPPLLLLGIRFVYVLSSLLFSLLWPIDLLLVERFLSGCRICFLGALFPWIFAICYCTLFCPLIFFFYLLWPTDLSVQEFVGACLLRLLGASTW